MASGDARMRRFCAVLQALRANENAFGQFVTKGMDPRLNDPLYLHAAVRFYDAAQMTSSSCE